MSSRRSTRELVAEAADAMLAAGQRPSVAAVLKEIGQGSATTVNDALRQWWEELGARLQAPKVPKPVYDSAQALWAAALEKADETLAAERKTLALRVADAESRAEAAVAGQRQAEQRLKDLEQRVDQAEQRGLDLERRLIAQIGKTETAEALVDELRRALAEKDAALSAQAAEHKEALASERERSDALERRLAAQIDEQKKAVERLSKAKDKVEQDLARRQAQWQTHATRVAEALQQARDEATVARQQLATAREREDEFKEREHQLQEQLTDLRKENEQRLAVVGRLEAEQGHAREEIDRLTKERRTLETTLERERRALKAAQARIKKSGRG